MSKLRLRRTIFLCCVFCAATAICSPTTITFTTLVNFDVTDGAQPYLVSLVQGFDGNFYGTTSESGVPNKFGTVFKITPEGAPTTLHSFCSETKCLDGNTPYPGLILATNGNFYGTTQGGGAGSRGTVFDISPGGKLTTIYAFCSETNCADGESPYGGLIQASNGNFYGTTWGGGNGDCSDGCGTVFEITGAGKLTTIYRFCSKTDCADGAKPYGGLVQASNGNFYGTTWSGGGSKSSNGCFESCGTVFEITPAGKLTTLYSFCSQAKCADGSNPAAGLIQASNGNFYGTTNGGPDYQGTVFEITAAGKLTTLYSFCQQVSCLTGYGPYAGLIQATDRNLYGTTFGGGTHGDYGTVFEITAAGKLTTLYSFSGANGDRPTGGLVQATNGTFYGTTNIGGKNSDGTVFSLSTGLAPFVRLRTASGKVGSKVTILGMKLTGASKVEFNGTPAEFTIPQSGEIIATVPSGATTGYVAVATPSGTLRSSTTFAVIPQIRSFEATTGPVGTSVPITGVSLTQTSEVTFDGVKPSLR